MTDGIGVPKGGGALSGIGETFQPDLHTGTAHMSIPVPLPPGRNDFTPKLELAYSSAAGNGPFGLGWSLDVPRIARRTDRGVPVYHDELDTFVLSGAEELAAVPLGNAGLPDLPATATVTRYRPRTETLFARILHVVDASQDYWDVWSKDGLRSTYGSVRPSDAPPDWVDPAVIRTPNGAAFAWLLSETRDTFGSRVRYRYRTDDAQLYLDRVEYAEYGDIDDPAYAATVHISYDDQRDDPFSDRRPGFELRTRLRATQIAVTTVASAGRPVSTMDLGYGDGPHSLLTSVLSSGHDPAIGSTQSMPPITFDYSQWNPSSRTYRPLSSTLPPVALGSGLEIVDLFADGLPSVVELGHNGGRYWRNLGDGNFALPRSLADVPPVTLGQPSTMFTDLNGDARPELISAETGPAVWQLAGPSEKAGLPGFSNPHLATSSVTTLLTEPHTRLVDLDGNHLLDLLTSGPTPLAATGDGTGNWSNLRPLLDAPLPLTDLSNPRVRIADMTGDGLSDVVLIHDRSIRYWPSLGHGRYGAPIQMVDAPHFADAMAHPGVGFDPRRLLLGDITGDGAADVVYVADGSVAVWLNIAGNRLSEPTVVYGTPRVDSRTDVRLADIDGTGVTGLLWSGLGMAGKWAFLDFIGGMKPYLLTDIDNHRGASTHLVWSTSTAFATADRTAGKPWQTSLPFPVHVIAASEVGDHFSGTVLSTSFRYHDGYWDPADREFRGFGCVEQIDTLAQAKPQPPAPPTFSPLDALTPVSSVSRQFAEFADDNLLQNWSFDTPREGRTTTVLTTTAAQPFGGGDAAAVGWTTWNNSPGTTTTELRPSTLPQGHGGSMIRVTTEGPGSGIVQLFGAIDTGPARADASAWIYVVSGSVAIGTGNGGDTPADAVVDRTGEWVLVSAGNQRSPANEFIVYSAKGGNCEFFVDHAWIRKADVPSSPIGSPPVRTVTWFHLGPVGPATGAWSSIDSEDRYWPADPPLLPPLDNSSLPASLPRSALREALRAARGRVLRTESYCDDGSQLSGRPYIVQDNAFETVPVLDGRTPDDASWLDAPVVTARDTVSRHTEWDRGAEPMTRVTAAGGYDDYSRPTFAAIIGVPRGRKPSDEGGVPCLATTTTTTYATRDDASGYRLDRTARITRHEAVDPGTGTVLDFAQAVRAGGFQGELRSVSATYYDGAPFRGLDLGDLGDHGLPTRSEQLVVTAARLAEICAPVRDGGTSASVPPYLDSAEEADWTVDYPAPFVTSIEDAPTARGAHLGYVWRGGADRLPEGWYAPTAQLTYDFHTPQAGRAPRGNTVISRDAYGGDTIHSWDPYELLLVQTIDPVGLLTSATYDYCLFKPIHVTDANDNRTMVGYTPLGLPAWIAKLGKTAVREGDTIEQPGQQFDYDLNAWDASAAGAMRQPMNVRTVRRIDHRWTIVNRENDRRKATGQPPLTDDEITAFFPDTELEDHPERFVRVVEFTDGFGRLLQSRTQGDEEAVSEVGLPGDLAPATRTVSIETSQDRVVVSGWQIYDNKGRPIVVYEPFFDQGYDFVPADDGALANLAAVQQHYDARGRKTVTVAPDRSQTRIVYGIPLDIGDPANASPTPWESWTYDPNDNAGRTHPTMDLPRFDHWNTPSSSEVDALGRTIRTVHRGLGRDVITTIQVDIDGQPIAVTDPLGRLAARTVYDHTGKPWTSWLLDAGTARTFHDAAGGVIEHRDDKGALALHGYDAAHRKVLTWAADHATQELTLREVDIYGDDAPASGLSKENAVGHNLLSRIVISLDEVGRVTTSNYDLDGNATAVGRQIIRPDLLLSRLPRPDSGPWADIAYAVDWQVAAGQTLAQRTAELLDPTSYEASTAFDALGRPTDALAPTDVTGARAATSYSYGRGGGIVTVEVDGQPYVQAARYDAHGRRSLAWLGNGVLLRYAYDPKSLRLRRVRAEHATRAGDVWTCDGPVLQDLAYRHDQNGNPLTIADRAPGSGILPGNPDALDRQFSYDALDRLTNATGRETDTPADAPPWSDQPRSWDVTRARDYTESYSYDVVGNLLTLQHRTDASGVGAYTRALPPVDGSNQLASLTVGRTTTTYTYDPCGNMLTEATNRSFEWDHANRLATFRDQAGPGAPSVYAQYRYDPSGQRVVKVVRKSSGPDEVTLYFGGFERLLIGAVGTQQTPYDELHLTDHESRLALIRRGDAVPDDALADQPVLYQLGDHLTSVTATLDAAGGLLNREEYLPYGETSFGSYTRKRYRFTGRERDGESGLSYHHARYYASLLGRWTSCDPKPGTGSGSLYSYCGNRPLQLVDKTGASGDAPAALRPSQPPASAPAPAEFMRRISGEGLGDGMPRGALRLAPPAGSGATSTGATVAEISVTAGAVLAAAGSMVLLAETIHDATAGRDTPIDVADKFYDTHFGDIAGWISGRYDSTNKTITTGKRDDAPARRLFREYVTTTILQGCYGAEHPLRKLLDKAGRPYPAGDRYNFKDPIFDAGHVLSLAGGGEGLGVEWPAENRYDGSKDEKNGTVLDKVFVDVCRVPIEYRYLRVLEEHGMAPKGTSQNAPRTGGWVPDRGLIAPVSPPRAVQPSTGPTRR